MFKQCDSKLFAVLIAYLALLGVRKFAKNKRKRRVGFIHRADAFATASALELQSILAVSLYVE